MILLLIAAMLLAGCSSTATTAAPVAAVPTSAPTAAPTIAPTVAPSATPEPRTLTVFAAASLTDAFSEIGKAFEAANPGVTVSFNFAGSQALRTQIEQGAKADVFASANTKEMDTLVTGSFVATDSAQIFLNNKLVVIMPANNPAGLSQLADLAKSGLKLDLAAKEVPVGKYALQVLDKLDAALGGDFKTRVLANVVSYENDVKQVVTKVQLGEADAGIVYTSDAVAAPELQHIDIPSENNVVAKYPIAALVNTKNTDLSKAFIDFVLSSNGQDILAKWGFMPVK
jgi:molybdate transport system substrate-binding protein